MPAFVNELITQDTRVFEVENLFTKHLRAFFDVPRLYTSQIDDDEFKDRPQNDFRSMCSYMAAMEKLAYDRRADVLRSFHPLAMQVNLSDGVANGIMVARNYQACAEILRDLLLSKLKFAIECEPTEVDGSDAQDTSLTQLIEIRSRCPFRVVTGHKRITNSFWNFYLKEKGE